MADKHNCTVTNNGNGTYTVSCSVCGTLDTHSNRYTADNQKSAHENTFN